MSRQKTGIAVIKAIWNSRCKETKTRIMKGEMMVYDYDNKDCYCINSNFAIAYQANKSANDMAANDKAYVEAQENAYFDNFSRTL